MFSNSLTVSAPRYLVFRQSASADKAELEKVFCNTIREARQAASRFWREANNPALAISNGFGPANVPAAMVANSTKRYGRLTVARQYGATRREIGIIAL